VASMTRLVLLRAPRKLGVDPPLAKSLKGDFHGKIDSHNRDPHHPSIRRNQQDEGRRSRQAKAETGDMPHGSRKPEQRAYHRRQDQGGKDESNPLFRKDPNPTGRPCQQGARNDSSGADRASFAEIKTVDQPDMIAKTRVRRMVRKPPRELIRRITIVRAARKSRGLAFP